MQRNTLLLIDLSENLNFEEKNKEYIYLNKGNIRLNNCKQIKLKDFVNLRKKIYSNFIKKLKKFILLNEKKKFFLSEMEIFNLRNDRYDFPDRILNYLIIKELIFKKKFKKVKIISDNKVTLKIFDNLNVEIEKKNFSKFDLKFRLPHLKIIKFLIKAMILVFYCKLSKFKKKEKSEKNTYYLSLLSK